MSTQGSYPLNGRTVTPSDTVTGVVTGQTADIPISSLVGLQISSGPSSSRPASPSIIGYPYFDTTLGFAIWAQQISPSVVWVNAAGVVQP